MPGERTQLAAATAVLSLILLGACKGRPFVSVPDQDYGVSSSQFSDIPVPDGMKLMDHPNTTDSNEASGWRYGNFVYSGPTSLEDATTYMQQRMPLHAWTLSKDEVPAPDARVLLFVRGNHSAECVFTRQSATTRMEVHYRTQATQR